MKAAETTDEPRHPIGVVSSRTGLAQDVLRAWERRYGAVVPHRTATGRRLYTDHDLEKLRLLRRAVESGRRISDVASLALEELQALVREDRVSGVPARTRGGDDAGVLGGTFVERALAAIRDLDAIALDGVLADASVELPPAGLRREVLHPLLERLGNDWRSGALRVAHEHLGSAVIRSFLGSLRLARQVPRGAPCVVVTTPSGQRHELGAFLAATAAMEIGWDAVYLGPNLPAREIAAAARQKSARAVALSLVFPSTDPGLGDELRELRRLLGASLPVFVGGAAAPSYAAVLDEIGAQRVDEGTAFQAELEALNR